MKKSEIRNMIKEEIEALNESNVSSLKDLIDTLQEKYKNGAKKVEIQGTLLIPDNGNFIVLTDRRQK